MLDWMNSEPATERTMRICDPYLPERRTVLTGQFQLIGVHVNMMHGQVLCSDSAGEVLGRGEAGSARGRAGSASCPCVIQSSNAEHEDPARSSHPREVDVQRKTPFCSFGLGRVRASMTRNPERLKKERRNVPLLKVSHLIKTHQSKRWTTSRHHSQVTAGQLRKRS